MFTKEKMKSSPAVVPSGEEDNKPLVQEEKEKKFDDDSTEGCMTHWPHGETIGSAFVGFLTGFLGSMAGVGGGPFCVPLLGWLLGLGHKKCVGTSILCGLTTLTVGGITTFAASQLNISLIPITVLAAVAPLFGYVSAKMSNNISPLILKQIFAGFLLVCSLQIVWGLAYSPTGAEGHWQYNLHDAPHVYEIEASEGKYYFRTQNFGGVLKAVKDFEAGGDGSEIPGGKPPEGYEEGWFAVVSHLEGGGRPEELPATERAARGVMWVKVLNRGESMETLFHSYVNKDGTKGWHWNDPVTAQRKKNWIAMRVADMVDTLAGNVIFHLIIAVTAGCASGLLGIAGGSVVVPLMSLSGAFQWQVITTTSLLSMIPTSLTTCYTHHTNGNVALRLAPGLVGGTVVGAFSGSKLMAITSEVVRRSACAGVLLLTACIMLYQGTKHYFTGTKNSKPSLLKLAAAVIFFYCMAALLQEKVFNLPEFSHEYLLTFLQSLVVCGLAFYDLNRSKKCVSLGPSALDENNEPVIPCDEEANPESPAVGNGGRKVPLSVYIGLAFLGTFGAISTNKASVLLDFTSQVVFKSSKLQWIMLWRVLFIPWKRRPTWLEWVCAAGLSVGLIVFTLAGARVADSASNDFQMGVVSILLALACDATLYTVEESIVFAQYKADKHELLLWLSGLSVPTSFLMLLSSGSLSTSWLYLQMEWRFPTLVVAFAFCNYIGTKYVLQIIQEYDSSMAVLCTSLRKVFTVILSYTLFPKSVTPMHLAGLVLIFSSSYYHLYYTERAAPKDTGDGKDKPAQERDVDFEDHASALTGPK